MFINALRDEVLQHFAIILDIRNSRCRADVLFYVCRVLRRASTVLGYPIPEPPAGRDEDFYKSWILREAGAMNQAAQGYRVLDGGMTNSLLFLKNVVQVLRQCPTQDSDPALDLSLEEIEA